MKPSELTRLIDAHLRIQPMTAKQLALRVGVSTRLVNQALYKGLPATFQRTSTESSAPIWTVAASAAPLVERDPVANRPESQNQQGVRSEVIEPLTARTGDTAQESTGSTSRDDASPSVEQLLRDDLAKEFRTQQMRAQQLRDEGPASTPPRTIVELGLPTRAQNALLRKGFRTTRELLDTEPSDFFQIPNFGGRSLVDLAAALARFGIWFGDKTASPGHHESTPSAQIEGLSEWQTSFITAEMLDQWASFGAFDSEIPVHIVDAITSSHERAIATRRADLALQVPRLVKELGLSERALNCLLDAQITTVRDLLHCSPESLLNFRGLGTKSLIEISETLAEWGLWFGWQLQSLEPEQQTELQEPEFGRLQTEGDLDSILHHIKITKGATVAGIADLYQLPVEQVRQLLATHFRVYETHLNSRMHNEFRLSARYRRDTAAAERVNRMIELRSSGATLEQIGDEFGITRERVRQLIAKELGPEGARQLFKDGRDLARQNEFNGLEHYLQQNPAVFPVPQEVSELLTLSLKSGSRLLKPTKERWSRVVVDWLYQNPGHHPQDFENLTGIQASTGLALAGDDFLRFTVRTFSYSSNFSDEELLESLRLAATYEYPISAKKYNELAELGEVIAPTSQTVMNRFGSWNKACRLAGVEGHEPPKDHYDRRWSERDMWAITEEFLLLNGHRASFREFEEWLTASDELPSGARVRQVLGNWNDLKRAIYLSDSFREALLERRSAHGHQP